MNQSHAEKLQAAIEWMGPKWVLHKANHVPRLKEPLPNNGLRRFEPRVLRRKPQ